MNIYVQEVYMVEILLGESEYWLRYHKMCLDQLEVSTLANGQTPQNVRCVVCSIRATMKKIRISLGSC